LPSEAEWEYAARGAVTNPDYLYAGSNDAGSVAWYNANSGTLTHMIGHLQPNGLGIYDMSGNVNEWCWDWYNSNYYNSSPVNNPTGPADGITKLNRGGNFSDNSPTLCRIVRRPSNYPWWVEQKIGLRLARTLN